MSGTDTIRLPHFVNRTDATRGILKLVRARPGHSFALVDLVGVEGSGKSLLLVAEQRREQVVDAFIESVTELATTRRAVLLLDAADVLLRQDVGFWLLTDVVAHLTNAVVVVARTSPKPDLPGRPDAERFTLVNFGREHC